MLSKKKINLFNDFEKVSYKLSFFDDQWTLEFKNWFEQISSPNYLQLKELANSELISENIQNLKKKLWDIFGRRFDIKINENDFAFLSTIGKQVILFETIYNTSVAYELIKKYLEDEQKSEQFKQDVLMVIDSDVGNFISRKQEEKYTWGYKDNIFYEYIDKLAENHNEKIFLKDIISCYLQYDHFKEEEDKIKLKGFLLDDWYQYLTVDIYQEKFYLEKDKTIIACLRSLSKIQVNDFNLKNMIIDVLNKIGEESEFNRRYMQDIIENHLD